MSLSSLSLKSSPYAPAAQLLQHIWTRHKSLKTLAYDKNGNLRCSKSTYAQVCHVLQHKKLLDTLVERIPIKNVYNEGLLFVLLYELLLGPNLKIRGGGALKRQIMAKESELRSVLEELQQQDSSCSSDSTLVFPRYARINTLQANQDQVTKELALQHESLYIDEHVPNLLVMKPNSLSAQDSLIQSGKLILQDKSSCFSALCLIHGNAFGEFQGDMLDACAAPGNKTSHLAALLGDRNSTCPQKVFALDRSSERVKSLTRRMQLLTNNNRKKNVEVVTQHLDFLTTNPSSYPSIRGILLDPSCSGSGIFTSPDRLHEAPDDTSRLTSLSNFQLTALKHAMSFSQVERIVYSTCSLHTQENELVVSQALENNKDWVLVSPACLENWKRRGIVVEGLSSKQASCLIRANRDDDTNGFFVAYLERKSLVKATKKRKQASLQPPSTRIEGIPVYNGEFFLINEEASGKESAQKKSTASSTTKPKNEKANIHKKRAKKLAWKRRQTEQKLRRIEKKNAKQDKKED